HVRAAALVPAVERAGRLERAVAVVPQDQRVEVVGPRAVEVQAELAGLGVDGRRSAGTEQLDQHHAGQETVGLRGGAVRYRRQRVDERAVEREVDALPVL